MPQRQFENFNFLGRPSNDGLGVSMNSRRQGEYVAVSDEGIEMR